MKLLFYDLETQFLAQELPNGWQDADLMRVSSLCYIVAEYNNGGFTSFYTDIVQEANVCNFFNAVKNSDFLVSWGGSYLNKVLHSFDQDSTLKNKRHVDLKDLSHEFSPNGSQLTLSGVADAIGFLKLGNGVDAVKHYRDGHWYELCRLVLWDTNILPSYFLKILGSAHESLLLAKDADGKQISVHIGKIKDRLKKMLDESFSVQTELID